MGKIKRSMWNGVFKSMISCAKRLMKHPEQLSQIIEEALKKIREHSAAIRQIAKDLQTIIRLIKAWLAGDYEDIPIKALVLLIAAILYFLSPFDAIPDAIPVVGFVDDVGVVAWVLKTLKDELEKFRLWESVRANR